MTYHNGYAIFIDTLSFDFYEETTPWRAYKQFVMHFLGPLVLAKYHGSDMLKILQTYLDGVPLKLLSSILPTSTKLNATLYTNIHLLAKAEKKYNNVVLDDAPNSNKTENNKIKLTIKAQLNLITNLYNYIKGLEINEKSEWGNYYNFTNYKQESLQHKSKIINTWVNNLKPEKLIDVGGNDGKFVRDLEHQPHVCLIGDIDNNAVDSNFKKVKQNKENHILPFILNVLNPSAGIGFDNKERTSLTKRLKDFKPDLTLALALIHHMSLSGNIPFDRSAEFFASFSKYLIIEFSERKDSYVKRLLNQKREFKTHFEFYSLNNFEVAFTSYFKILGKVEIVYSNILLYLIKKNGI